jgi:hypothetical protein
MWLTCSPAFFPPLSLSTGTIEVGYGHPAELFEVREAGFLAGVTNTVAEITGREPRSYEEFARDHKEAFSGAPAEP